jgi:GxxExxY protein
VIRFICVPWFVIIHHRGTESLPRAMERRDTESPSYKQTYDIVGAAIQVHRHLGPGLLESAYERCLSRELLLRDIRFQRQVPLPVEYRGIQLDCSYRLDIVVGGSIIIEVKAVCGTEFAESSTGDATSVIRLSVPLW